MPVFTWFADFHNEAFEGVCGGNVPPVDGDTGTVCPINQSCDGRGLGGFVHDCFRKVGEVSGCAGLGGDGFDVCGIVAFGCAHECVFAIGGNGEEFFRCGTPHCAGGGFADGVF